METKTQNILILTTFSSAIKSLFYKNTQSIFVCQGKPNHQTGHHRTRHVLPGFPGQASRICEDCHHPYDFVFPVLPALNVGLSGLNVPCKLFFYPKNYQKPRQSMQEGRQITGEGTRRTQIIRCVPIQWSYVPSVLWPASEATKGLRGLELRQLMLSRWCTVECKRPWEVSSCKRKT